MKVLFLLLALVGVAFAAKLFVKAKVGQELKLSLRGDIKNWNRKRSSTPDVEEFIYHCPAGSNEVRCNRFVDKDGNAIQPDTEAIVNDEGNLVIESVAKTDAGFYYSNDEVVRPSVAKTLIVVTVE